MKSVVIYYSHFGNTAHVAANVSASLKEKGQAD